MLVLVLGLVVLLLLLLLLLVQPRRLSLRILVLVGKDVLGLSLQHGFRRVGERGRDCVEWGPDRSDFREAALCRERVGSRKKGCSCRRCVTAAVEGSAVNT